jgi:polar amino acid transport system substrate-binding protein
MPLETILTAPWGAAVRLEERDGPWGQFVAKTISDWHRSGKLTETEKKWGILPSAFLKNAREGTK